MILKGNEQFRRLSVMRSNVAPPPARRLVASWDQLLIAFLLSLQTQMRDDLNFDDLFRLYYDSLFRFARQFINDDEDCHDIVSNAYEDVWRNFSHIEEKTVKAYLYTTVRNRTIDYLRRQQKRQQYISYATHMMEQTISSEHIAEREDNLRIIKQVLDEIGHPTSDILTACYIDGKKYVEVAEEMQISIASVKKHMVKALKKVREIKKRLKQ